MPPRLPLLGLLAVLAAPASALAGDEPAATCAAPREGEPEALFEAANCRASAGGWGVAAQHYQRLIAEFPTHALAEASLLRLVRGHQAIARFADAVGFAEQYAARYPASARTPDLLIEAALMRVGLGQRKQAVADLDRVDALLMPRDPARAAEVFWSRRALFAHEDGNRLAHAMIFLERYGEAAALDRRLVAELTIARYEWQHSCAGGEIDGLCITPRLTGPESRQPNRCGGEGIRVKARVRARAHSGQRRMAAVLRLAAGDPGIPADQPQRRREYEEAIGLAALYAADARLEQFLAIEVPARLSFQVEEWRRDAKDARSRRTYADQVKRRGDSQRRFDAFLRRSGALAAELEQRYGQRASERRSVTVAIAAMARIGQLARARADALLAIEVPPELTSEPARAAFCAALREQTTGLHAQADQAQQRCLELASHSGEFGEFARLCEAALQRRGVREAAAQRELFDAPARPITRMESIGVQLDPTPFMTGT